MYKKVLGIIAAAAVCGIVTTACGGKSSSSGDPAATETSAVTALTETETAADTAAATETAVSGNKQTSGSGSAEYSPENTKGGDIIGEWIPGEEITDLDASVSFGEDGTGALYIDISGLAHFSDGPVFSALGSEVTGEDLVTENGSIKAYINHMDEDSLLIQLDRISSAESGSSSSFDGEYNIAGGRLADTLDAYIDGEFGGYAGDIPITAVVNGERLRIKLGDAFSYTTEGNRLKLALMSEIAEKFSFLEGKELFYTAESDKLTVVTSDGDGVTMERAIGEGAE